MPFRVLLCDRLAGYRVPRPRLLLVVSDGSCGSYRPPSPLHLRKTVRPLLGYRPLQSASDSFRPTGSACASPAAFLGVAVPSSRCQSPAALRAASQSHPPSVLDVSHVLDGLLRLRPRGFVSPHNHVQGFSLQGFVPPTQPSRLIDVSSPLVVAPVLLPSVARRRRFPGPRPQGFALTTPVTAVSAQHPRGNPLSLPWPLSRRPGAIPSWLFPSSRFSLFRPWPRFRAACRSGSS